MDDQVAGKRETPKPASASPSNVPAASQSPTPSVPPEVSGGDETFVLPMGVAQAIDTIYNRFLAHYTPFGFQPRGEEVKYHPLPYKPEPDDPLLLMQPWRIELELHTAAQRKVMGLDLYGDVVLGRGPSRPGRIILDLDGYGAHELGVSREHLMLRPTRTRLFAIDQGSTNGTTINGATSGRGMAVALHDDDMIALGNMVLLLRIIKKPDTAF